MTSRASPKSDLIETILRRHGPLPINRIVEEMQLMGVDAKPNNVRSLMSILFKRFVSLKPGLWQLQDPALGHAERVLTYEQSRGREVSSDMLAFLQTYDEPKTPSIPKLRNGDMKRDATVKELKQILQQLQKKMESLRIDVNAIHRVIALFEARPPDDDDPVTTPVAEVEFVDVVTPPVKASVEPKSRPVKRAPVGKERPPSDVFERPPKRKSAGLKAPCPRCSATAVTTEDDFSICISCGWSRSKVTEADLS